MRILLASASGTARKIIRGVLERAGYVPGDLMDIADRKALFSTLKDHAVAADLAVVDWDLPELDGPALARYLRASFADRVGVLFCVKPADRAALSGITELGPCDWIERPFADEAFLRKVVIFQRAAEKAKADDSAKRLRAIAAGKDSEVGLPFLLQLPSHFIDDLLKKSIRSRHAPGTILLRPDDVPEALHLVTRGEVEILEGTAGIRSRVSGLRSLR